MRQEILYGQLADCCQGRHETVRQYADRYRYLAEQLSIPVDGDPLHMYNFMRGFDRRIYMEMYRMRPRSLSEAIAEAI